MTRICKRCGLPYDGWNCKRETCVKARKAHNASSARSRARNGCGRGRSTKVYASAFHWSADATSIGPIHPGACPKQDEQNNE